MIEYNNNYYMSKSIYDCFTKMVDANFDPSYLFSAIVNYDDEIEQNLDNLSNIIRDVYKRIINSKNKKYITALFIMSLNNKDDFIITSTGFIFTVLNEFEDEIIKYCLFLYKNKRLVEYPDFLEMHCRGLSYRSKFATYIFNIGILIIYGQKMKKYNTMVTFNKYVNRLFI